jgi:molybdenum cofactor biosynthesis enzyme MoaA
MDNYCSQKFWYLKVDIEKQEIQSCCTAVSERVDIDWIYNNSGQLFNTPNLKAEREKLLAGKRVSSCSVCWRAEDSEIPSKRQLSNSRVRSHSDVNAVPRILDVTIGSDCNLTCSYCCKQYSSAWTNDIVVNGEYHVSDPNRYSLTQKDKIIYKLSQKEIMRSTGRSVLLNEVALLTADIIRITGGEPFLNLDLVNLISMMPTSKSIEIYSGLGVNQSRLINEIEKIKHVPNIKIVVSAENIGKHYEFNRYGNSFDTFTDNLEVIKRTNIPFKFAATVSNTTVFGLADFVNEFHNHDIDFNLCEDPDFLSINVLDDESKIKLSKSLKELRLKIPGLIETIIAPCDQKQKQEAAIFIKEFASRRNLSLSIFPESFINWINE